MVITLKQIYKDDQSDRISGKKWRLVLRNDKKRRAEVEKILISGKKLSAEELYYAAMIYHHSGTKIGTKKALILAKECMHFGRHGKRFTKWGEKSKWLVAATTDRLLVLQGKPQKYGTQYKRKNPDSPLELYDYDKNTTDEERKGYNVLSLKQIMQELAKLNKLNKNK